MPRRPRLLACCALTTLTTAWIQSAQAAAKEQTIYDGLPSVPDGLILNKGELTGVSEVGVSGTGTTYALVPPSTAGSGWAVKLLNVFSNNPYVGQPAELASDRNGNLYVNLIATGSSECMRTPACGAVATGSGGTIYSFQDYVGPRGKVAIGKTGDLYISTQSSILQLSPPASGTGPYTATTIFSDTNYTGLGGLVIDESGALYGVARTLPMAATSRDIVYKVTPPSEAGGKWAGTILKSFNPNLEVGQIAVLKTGAVVGTTGSSDASCPAGSCAVFELTPSTTGVQWTETVIHDFAGDPLGRPLLGYDNNIVFVESDILSVGPDGSIYGAIAPATISNTSNSTIYRLTSPAAGGTAWTETALYTFQTPPNPGGQTGGFIAGSPMVITKAGTVYGTAVGGVVKNNASDGIAFKITQSPD